MEREEEGIMQRPPRKPSEGIFAAGLGFDAVWQGICVTALTLTAYFVGIRLHTGYWHLAEDSAGISMAFLTMSMTEIFHSFNMRSQRGSVFSMHSSNPYLWAAMVGSLALTTAVLFWPPAAAAFGFEVITLQEYGVALALALLIIPIVETVKAVLRRLHLQKSVGRI